MRHGDLGSFLRRSAAALRPGPVAAVFAEDGVELDSTIRHHVRCGFRSVLAFMPPHLTLDAETAETAETVHRIDCDTLAEDALPRAINRLIAAAPGTWFHYCYNAEYLFYPFCETRSVGEMLAFHAEERRDAMLTYVVDLYADELEQWPGAVSLDRAHLDRAGYYAQSRPDRTRPGKSLERQLNFYGGLRWRFEEHVPEEKRRIDRVSLFRAKKGLTLLPDHTFDDQEYNTYACPWHHSLTAAVLSFRTAKALKRNPGSSEAVRSFMWRNSVPFEWHSRQLLDLGLMEPGQWF